MGFRRNFRSMQGSSDEINFFSQRKPSLGQAELRTLPLIALSRTNVRVSDRRRWFRQLKRSPIV
ncbi:MAG: hypothetical protein KME17_14340 [Cyanosarcina radialis HA8281-LM2]|nr:hypothetical protein [Cyanosarcina radialis HA8281-LM2]